MSIKKMLAVNYQTNDSFAVYGINHFIQKFGLNVNVNIDKPSRICISYGNTSSSGDFTIEVPEKKIEDEFLGYVQIDGQETPVFELIDENTSRENNKIVLNFDVFGEVGHILSGHLENLPEEQKKKIIKLPLVDIYEKFLFDKILFAAKQLGISFNSKPLWPDGKKFAVCLTHDVDEVRKTYQYFTKPLIHAKKLEFKRALNHLKSFFTDRFSGNNPYWTFERLIGLEEELGVKSTFFFLQEDAKVKFSKPRTWRHRGRRYRFDDLDVTRLIKRLSSGGWEVGLHGSFDSYNDLKKLGREKKDLEEVLGGRVYGIRQHNLNLKVPDTWQHQEKIGLEYDTTLGFNNCLGFRYGTSFPFNPINSVTRKSLSILEIPLVIEDIALFRENDIWGECTKIANTVENFGGVLTLLWHHSVFNNQGYDGWSEMYERIINFCKEKNVWITTANEINKWWRSRQDV